MNLFKVSVWSRSKHPASKPLGKTYRLSEDGDLIKEDPCTNADNMEVIEFKDLVDLESYIDLKIHGGAAFMTSGIPRDPNITSAPVTVKDHPKKGHITRTQDDIQWRPGSGTYFPIDYDPAWDPKGPRSIEESRQAVVHALNVAGVDVSKLKMLTYPSSSSGFVRTSDGHSFDSGGRHLIFLVEDAGDLQRFRESLLVFMALTGSCYGAVAESGHFLQRGVIDLMAISPNQPTFAGVPAYDDEGLGNVREEQLVSFLGGDTEALDTRTVRDPTSREMTAYKGLWAKEEARLKPDIDRKKREWLKARGEELNKRLPDASPEQIRMILEHRWSGNLVASDVIVLNKKPVAIREILLDPDKYDGATGPDPIDPEYQGGAQKCKVYLNRDNGRPIIFSQAHWGVSYRLWYDVPSALQYLDSMDVEQAQAALKPVLQATRANDQTQLEYLLTQLAKCLKTTKKALTQEFGNTLQDNMHAVSSFDLHGEITTLSLPAYVNDIAHRAALTLISREKCIQTDDSASWRYNGTHHEPVSERHLTNKIRQILTEPPGWLTPTGLTGTTKQAQEALKDLTYSSLPIIAKEPKMVINFKNCELHFHKDGSVERRAHDPSSGLTFVLPFNYDPDATASIFQQTLDELFYPPAHERMKPRTARKQAQYKKKYRAIAIEMREYVVEIIAYMIIPDRWIPAWFLWIGDGHNGKTFLTRIIGLLLEERTIESDRLQAITSDNFGLERLIGKTLFIDDDLDINSTIPDGFVKKFSEKKPFSANRKNKTSVTSMNRIALLLLANSYPRLVDVSPGMRRRIHSLVFPRRFFSIEEIEAMPEGSRKEFAKHDVANLDLIDKIRNELPGVTNVLVAAYQRLIERGGFSMPEAVKAANERVLLEGNPLPSFIKNECLRAPDARYKTSDFAYDLKSWTREQNIHWSPSNPQIRNMMRHLGWTDGMIVKIDGNERYCGIGPKRRSRSELQKTLYKEFHKSEEDEAGEEELEEWLR